VSARPVVPGPSYRPKITVLTLQEKRRQGQRITMLTAHDYPTARALEAAGVDAILVGDSLAMVALGHPDTLSVTMDEMLHHARAVSNGARTPLLIGDLPFMSYQASTEEAVRNAGRFLKEGGMDAAKMEGGQPFADTVRAIVRAGIPVQGHIGLRPQSVKELGGFRVQGKTAGTARTVLEDALALEDAGCFSIVLEAVPERVAAYVTDRLEVPTIGIGAGAGTSGQVLVTADILGLYDDLLPRFARRYGELGETMTKALRAFREEVEARSFPAREHAYAMPPDEWDAFLASVPPRRAATG
jgi:3-methyl-2-oxobutanoate hydroxymethyltransferase